MRVRHAVESRRHGVGRGGGLKLAALNTVLRVEWIARGIHPWEQNSGQDHKDRLFTEQCLDDTLAVIEQLFKEMPDLSALEIGVRREASEAPLLAGVVKRAQLEQAGHRAPGMKLKMIGIQFHVFNWKLEPLDGLVAKPHGVHAGLKRRWRRGFRPVKFTSPSLLSACTIAERNSAPSNISRAGREAISSLPARHQSEDQTVRCARSACQCRGRRRSTS